MRRNYIVYILFIVVAAGLCILVWRRLHKSVQSTVVSSRANILTAYTPPSVAAENRLKIPAINLYIKWWDSNKESLKLNLKDSVSRYGHLMITIETWGTSDLGMKGASAPLEDVTSGDYDEKIRSFCYELSDIQDQVYLSFNPEMEVPVKNFPWQYQSPVLYIDAFRHFSKVVNEICPKVKVIWSPAGYPGAEEYYPGDNALDGICIVLNSMSESLTNAYPRDSSMASVIKRKILRMRFMNKPLMIAGASSKKFNDSDSISLDTAIKNIEENKSILYSGKPLTNLPGNKTGRVAEKAPLIGVYDPKGLLINEQEISIEHLFIDWGNIEDGSLEHQIDQINRRKHSALLTIEPWRGKKWKTDANVLNGITLGKYDEAIRKIYTAVSKAKRTVYLRFAHEMEIPIHRYSWQSKDPVDYIKAYRYFMTFEKNIQSANIKRIWGPAGDRGSLEWWPGNDVVDYISFAVYGLPDKNITDPSAQESFEQIFNRKSYRMRLVDKPFFITEFGVKGPDKFQNDWLIEAAKKIKMHSNVYGISYFNFVDNPKVWGKVAAPNWAISRSSFLNFAKEIVP
jgi:beta-mannanase